MSVAAIGVGGAIVGGAVLGGAASLGGAAMESNATKSAADTQAQAAEYAANLQNSEFNQQQTNEAPWLQAGKTALAGMQNPYFQQTFNASDFTEDPGYQFNLQQGQNAIQASAAASGGLMNGNTLEALTNYSQNAASNEYQNAYNRFTNNQNTQFNRLASIAGMGQTGTGQLNQAGMTTANNIGNIATSNASAQGAASIANGNIWGNATSGIGSSLGGGLSTMGMLNYLNNNNQNPLSSAGALGSATSYGQTLAPGTVNLGGLSGGIGISPQSLGLQMSNM